MAHTLAFRPSDPIDLSYAPRFDSSKTPVLTQRRAINNRLSYSPHRTFLDSNVRFFFCALYPSFTRTHMWTFRLRYRQESPLFLELSPSMPPVPPRTPGKTARAPGSNVRPVASSRPRSKVSSLILCLPCVLPAKLGYRAGRAPSRANHQW